MRKADLDHDDFFAEPIAKALIETGSLDEAAFGEAMSRGSEQERAAFACRFAHALGAQAAAAVAAAPDSERQPKAGTILARTLASFGAGALRLDEHARTVAFDRLRFELAELVPMWGHLVEGRRRMHTEGKKLMAKAFMATGPDRDAQGDFIDNLSDMQTYSPSYERRVEADLAQARVFTETRELDQGTPKASKSERSSRI